MCDHCEREGGCLGNRGRVRRAGHLRWTRCRLFRSQAPSQRNRPLPHHHLLQCQRCRESVTVSVATGLREGPEGGGVGGGAGRAPAAAGVREGEGGGRGEGSEGVGLMGAVQGGGRVCDRGRDGCWPLRTQAGAAGPWTGLLLRAAPLGVVVPSPGARRRRVQPLQRASPAATEMLRWSVPSSR